MYIFNNTSIEQTDSMQHLFEIDFPTYSTAKHKRVHDVFECFAVGWVLASIDNKRYDAIQLSHDKADSGSRQLVFLLQAIRI